MDKVNKVSPAMKGELDDIQCNCHCCNIVYLQDDSNDDEPDSKGERKRSKFAKHLRQFCKVLKCCCCFIPPNK